MLAGRIIPPDCYLDASEILRRQYLAFLLDRAADRSLWQNTAIPEQQMPHRIGELFRRGLADDGWFRRFLDVAQSRNAELAAAFIALFPTMSAEAKQSVQIYAADGLEKTVGAAALAWRKRHEALQSRMRQIGKAFDALATASGDRERDAMRRQLFAEQRSVRGRRTRWWPRTPSTQWSASAFYPTTHCTTTRRSWMRPSGGRTQAGSSTTS